jgi:PIN domain nuclease of toxin-antitoxin system
MLLLDTHVLLWYLAGEPRLTATVRDQIAQPETRVWVSVASVWEMSIKRAQSKLTMPEDLDAALVAYRFEPLPITLAHALAAGALPPHHRDPFDRMLIAQAQLEGLTLVTHDERFRPYGGDILWA